MHKCPQKDIQKKSITDYKETFKGEIVAKWGTETKLAMEFL